MKHKLTDLAVDAVVFGYSNDQLCLLFIKRKIEPFKSKWAIPGGFVGREETLIDAVKRELKEETNLAPAYLEQLYTFDDPKRDPRRRIISVSYYCLIPTNFIDIKADTDASEVSWFSVDKLPVLAFDHSNIVKVALERLRAKVSYQPVGFELLPPQFTFSSLEKLYEVILGRDIDRRNFRKKILSFGLLKEAGMAEKKGAGRPAMLYSFDEKKYQKLKKSGFFFEV